MAEAHTLAGRYKSLSSKREAYLNRAKACASVTIPSLVPPDEASQGSDHYLPYQGLGAAAVKNLGSKLLLGLLPPGYPFFRLTVDEKTLNDAGIDQASHGEVEATLASIERIAMKNIENKDTRERLHYILKHLLVAGNVLLYYGKKSVRAYSLSQYVVERDSEGATSEIIICESVSKDKLPAEAQAHVAADEDAKGKTEQDVKVYTRIYKTHGERWQSYQEVAGVKIETSQSMYPKGKNPWVAQRLVKVDGEDYGRSYVEEHMGDFNTLEVLTKAITQASIAAAKVIFLVKPGASAKPAALEKAPNGGFVKGNDGDVTALQMDKHGDFAIAQQMRQEVIQRLQESFLMTGAIRRDAERVTAEEIRQVTQMLEEGLGGLFTQLANTLQKPIADLEIGYLHSAGQLPEMPKDTLEPQIITGINALGREQELQKLQVLISQFANLGPEVLQEYVNFSELASRMAAALSIDTEGLILTPEQRKSRQQEQMMQQLGQEGGTAAIQQMMQGGQGGPRGQ